MLSLFSTLGGLLVSGLPALLNYFAEKEKREHELQLLTVRGEQELKLAEKGLAAKTQQVAIKTEAVTQGQSLDHDKTVIENASTWVVNYIATVRPTVTYIFVLELVLVNIGLSYWMFNHPGLITSVSDLVIAADIIFSSDEMAMLGGIIGFWFGSRNWQRK